MGVRNPLTTRESRSVQALYSHAAGVLVGVYERDEGGYRQQSIYVRDPATHDAERLIPPDERTSFGSAVVARTVPFVFFNVMKRSDGGGRDWLYLARANILTREVEPIFTPPELVALTHTDPAWPIQPWTKRLLEVTNDGVILTCEIGIPEPRSDGSFRMKYGIYDLDLSHRTLVALFDLEVLSSAP